jgi:hypothetical protein
LISKELALRFYDRRNSCDEQGALGVRAEKMSGEGDESASLA